MSISSTGLYGSATIVNSGLRGWLSYAAKIKGQKITLSFASPKKKIIILYLCCDCEAIFL
jgi:hypothetical protein